MEFLFATTDLWEALFKTGITLITLLCSGLVGWSLKSIIDLRTRVAVNEAKDEASSKETDRRIKEVKEDIKDLRREQIASNNKLEQAVSDTNRLVREMGASVAKLHEEIAVIKSQRD